MRKLDQSNVSVETFALNIPDPFKIEPKFTVDLPAKCKALIFATKVWDDDKPRNDKGEKPIVDGWRVIIVNSKGVQKGEMRTNYNTVHDDYSSHDPLRVQLHLKRVAVALSKIKRTNVQEVEVEDGD